MIESCVFCDERFLHCDLWINQWDWLRLHENLNIQSCWSTRFSMHGSQWIVSSCNHLHKSTISVHSSVYRHIISSSTTTTTVENLISRWHFPSNRAILHCKNKNKKKHCKDFNSRAINSTKIYYIANDCYVIAVGHQMINHFRYRLRRHNRFQCLLSREKNMFQCKRMKNRLRSQLNSMRNKDWGAIWCQAIVFAVAVWT